MFAAEVLQGTKILEEEEGITIIEDQEDIVITDQEEDIAMTDHQEALVADQMIEPVEDHMEITEGLAKISTELQEITTANLLVITAKTTVGS